MDPEKDFSSGMTDTAEGPPRKTFALSGRLGLLLAILLAAVWAFARLEIGPDDLFPSGPGLRAAAEFFSHAFRPALDYESSDVPEGTLPLPLKAVQAAANTVIFASAAMSVAVPLALVLGFLASTAWWTQDPSGAAPSWRKPGRLLLRPLVYGAARLVIAGMRSVHELLWAMLFLAAFGLVQISAVIALAIPFAGVLAKVFSEMIDESPRDAALALRGAGASPAQIFIFGLLPSALPDLTAYTFYRFECALRSAAVLGFFGFPTLGYHIAASFENLHYGEVWTYLLTLFLLIGPVERWSGALRKVVSV